ncbi:dihydrodipicolinate synthase family protein [Pigmentiphaga soli]|uniref:Dihydrodipicolinate synthase family protein n=1 Tax=Pigmentiphaga soli TaxID=1007095 RepID=A0ABP8GCU3_9BURK
MATTPRLQGLLSPVVTPFKADYTPDHARFARHCQWLLDSGCEGLAVFGTNSEANSMSAGEKTELLDALVAAGVPGRTLMPGTGACSITEAAQLSAHAVRVGAAGVLMLPPFYYKGVSDEGLFRYYSEVIQKVGSADLRVYLYHIPPVAQVAISVALVERLRKAYPDTVVGLKDSSGDWNNTQAILDAVAGSDFDVFPGSEVFLLQGLRAGAKGCITATGNVNPAAIAEVCRNWRTDRADELQQGITRTRERVQKYPVIPALKALIAHYSGDAEWATVRPPLVELTADQTSQLVRDVEAIGFSMPGLRA